MYRNASYFLFLHSCYSVHLPSSWFFCPILAHPPCLPSSSPNSGALASLFFLGWLTVGPSFVCSKFYFFLPFKTYHSHPRQFRDPLWMG